MTMQQQNNVVQLQGQAQMELSDAELTQAADDIGLRPVRAFVRKERTKGAERQARYRERKEAAGEKQLTITADESTADVIRQLQADVAAGKPLHAALLEQVAKVQPAPQMQQKAPQAPAPVSYTHLRAHET
jgi:hypothetical protein